MNSQINFKENQIYNIVIFDSGLGGLSIYKKIEKKIPNVNYIYAFDNEAFPYGEKKETFIIERCLKMINAISKKINITIILIACNTASVTSLLTLKKFFKFPIIGIVPDIKKATKKTKNKIIGLLATKTTINNNYVQNLILSFFPKIIIKTLCNKKLVILAEKKLKYNFTDTKVINNILKPWYNKPNVPDTIILGCTHFYFLKKEIKKVLPKAINIIDSNIIIPQKLYDVLKNNTIKKENIIFSSKSIKQDKRLLDLFNRYKFLTFKKINL
ncbi:glutamate racemase [Buchnera aphidicola]|uniref:glutamate racemase n=1 Tax=Buchnera aphidicola TaxID=9 RepID=UPI0021C8E64D|nr:glutamate racemase [Buchnera aphidicola]